MLTRALPVIALSCAVVNAHAYGGHHILPRQGSVTTSHSSSTTSRPPTTTGSSTTSGTGSAPSTPTPPPQVSVSFAPGSTATDAVPLASILPEGQGPAPSVVPVSPPAAGSKPSALAGAPGLPDISNWSQMQTGYPSPDPTVPLDVNSDLVKGWISDVQKSGVQIPNIAPRYYDPVGGDNCNRPENAARKADFEKDGYWSCGHYTRTTDIVECAQPNTWGSSFDDGPSDATGKLLVYLQKENIKTTFFVVGTAMYWRPQIAQAAHLAGHQIAVHTWSHHALTNLTNNEIIAQLGWSKKIIKDAIGVTPRYFRAPYGDQDDRVRAIAQAMGLTPVIWTTTGTIATPFTFDTRDFEVPSGLVSASQSVLQFQQLLAQAKQYNKGFLVLEHDLFDQQVLLAIGYFLPGAKFEKFNIMPIYQCAGHDFVDAYVETTKQTSLPGGSTGSTPTTPGGPSGGNGGNGGNGGGSGALPMLEVAKVISATLIAGAFAVAAAF